MSRKPTAYAVLAVHARTGNGVEVCRVGNQDVALKIAARLRYEEVPREADVMEKRPKKAKKYDLVTTMSVFANGDMEPVVVR